jgi:hypothetical protein
MLALNVTACREIPPIILRATQQHTQQTIATLSSEHNVISQERNREHKSYRTETAAGCKDFVMMALESIDRGRTMIAKSVLVLGTWHGAVHGYIMRAK